MSVSIWPLPDTANTSQMNRISIYLRKDVKRDDSTSPLYASVITHGRKTRFPIDVWVIPNQWDSENQNVKGDSKEVEDINLIISNARAKISDVLVRARLSNQRIGGKELIHKYRNLDGGGSSIIDDSEKFIPFARLYLKDIASSISFGTYIRRKGILDKVEKYDPHVTFNLMTPEWLRHFASHCRNEFNNGPGTIKKNLDTIRLFYRVAIRKGLTRNDPFEHYKSPTHHPAVSFLNENEFKKLIKFLNSSLLDETEETVLDAFLFMGFTGMHYTDAKELKIEDIHDKEIHYRRQKTGVLVHVPICKPAAEFIAKYAGDRERGLLFQAFPTNQCVNRIIKIVAAKAGIRKVVTAKTARHTFATLFYKKTRDIGTLSKLLGHTSVKNTMIYAHIMDEDRVKGISVFDDMM